ncbi:unnamed protein product [Diamesa tonsa]
MNCEICETSDFKYSCPRCSIKYCSLSCYQSQSHMQCTEEFYKEQVLKQLSERNGNDVDEKKVLEMLARIEKTEEEDFEFDGEHIEDIDSDDSVEEEHSLAVRLAEVDLNNADDIWDRLTDVEKQEFKSIVYNGEVENIVIPVQPWWKLKLPQKLVSDEADDKVKIDKIMEQCPKESLEIKNFLKISTKTPAKCIIYNIANVLGAYTYIFQYYNGDHLEYCTEATYNLITICDNLKANVNFDTIATVVDSVMMNCLNTSLFFDPTTKELILSDIKDIINGPGGSKINHQFLLSALSDILCLFENAKFKQQPNKPKAIKSNDDKKKFSTEFFCNDINETKQRTHSTLLTSCQKKIEFYLSFVKHRYNEIQWPISFDFI